MKLFEADPSLSMRPDFGSGLSDRVLALRQREVSSLSLAEVALCLRQSVALAHVVPVALAAVAENPLLEAELYQGDLLWSLLHASNSGALTTEQLHELSEACASALATVDALHEHVVPAASEFLGRTHAV